MNILKKVVNRDSLSEYLTSMVIGYLDINLVPHLTHISLIGVVGEPQLGQKLVPVNGLAPQVGQISGVPINSLPQFLQNTFPPLHYLLYFLRQSLKEVFSSNCPYYFAFSEYSTLVFAAGNADIGIFSFPRSVDHASHNSHLDGLGYLFKVFIHCLS
jgi:hypothetical protein